MKTLTNHRFYENDWRIVYKIIIYLWCAMICLCSACDAVYSMYVYFQDPLTCFLPCVFCSLHSLNSAWSKCCSHSKSLLRSNQEKSMWDDQLHTTFTHVHTKICDQNHLIFALLTKLLLRLLKADDYFWLILTIIVIFLALSRLLKFILDEHQFTSVPTRS